MSGRMVWVTGVGAVTAAGAGAARLREQLLRESSAVRLLPDLDDLPAGRAPEVPVGPPGRRLDRSAALFVSAAEEAWRDAGLPEDGIGLERSGIIEGSSLGPLADILAAVRGRLARTGTGAVRPTDVVRFMTGAGGATFAQLHHLRGPVLHVSAGSVSSSCAIAEAVEKIAAGVLDVVVAGGAECPLQLDVVEHFRVAGVLAAPPEGAPVCCPFDARRTGTVLGEGAGVLTLEAADHATRRGAQPRAVLCGFGLSRETYSMIRPDPAGTGVAAAGRAALDGSSLDEIGWIKTHGTGTRLNDAAECRGLATLFGDRLARTPLCSLKPTLGHCLGASGAVETVAALLALEQGVIPATLGTTEPDPALPTCTVTTRAASTNTRQALLFAEGFGGRCVALAVRRA
jgi:3-oxoacyl-[acyl-carrier-protein] synthase II